MPGDRESILRTLKKLRAKLDSLEELGYEAEANSFAELIQKMTTQHQIEESELNDMDRDELDPMDRVRPDYDKYKVKVRNRAVDWLTDLARPVAYGHYCKLLVVQGTSIVVFAGRRSAAQTACEVYLKLVVLAESLADKEYVNYFYKMKREGDVSKARGFRTSFLIGFCSRIGQRYADWMEDLRKYYAHDTKALAVINTSHSQVEDWLDAQKVGTSKRERKGQSIQNHAGWARGRSTAENVDLSGGHKKIGG